MALTWQWLRISQRKYKGFPDSDNFPSCVGILHRLSDGVFEMISIVPCRPMVARLLFRVHDIFGEAGR